MMRDVDNTELSMFAVAGVAALAAVGCGPYPDRPNPAEMMEQRSSDTGSRSHGEKPDAGSPEPAADGGDSSGRGDIGSGTSDSEGRSSEAGKQQASIVDCNQVDPSMTIEIRERRFVGGDATVTPGTVVEFANREDDEHNVEYGASAGDPDRGSLFASDLMTRGDSVCIRFETPGDYPYLCRVHPTDMQRTITVRKTGDGSSGDTGTGVANGSRPQVVSCSDREPTVTIPIRDRSYVDGSPTVTAGGVVEWSNEDDEEHTVVSGTGEDDPDRGGAFDSGEFAPGERFCVEFPAGSYPYFCRERGADDMAGEITAE